MRHLFPPQQSCGQTLTRGRPRQKQTSATRGTNQRAQETRLRQVLDQDGLTLGVGERHTPVRVLGVGARLVLRAQLPTPSTSDRHKSRLGARDISRCIAAVIWVGLGS